MNRSSWILFVSALSLPFLTGCLGRDYDPALARITIPGEVEEGAEPSGRKTLLAYEPKEDGSPNYRVQYRDQGSRPNGPGGRWTGGNWTGGNWTGSNWTGNNWTGGNWTGSNWTGQRWTGQQWTGNNWTGNRPSPNDNWTGGRWSKERTGQQMTGSNWTGS